MPDISGGGGDHRTVEQGATVSSAAYLSAQRYTHVSRCKRKEN